MKASVTIPTAELSRLFSKAIHGKTFSKIAVREMAYKILNRIERDYPELLEGIYQTAHRKYQAHLSELYRLQKEQNLRNF